ncbi:MAG: response regulator transcription factor [Pseudomonas sp.]|uniref:response regulator transcription factor n=1 Tax=Pseudomonas abieticivorans TaxID=2931382 RepID=UPI0020C0F485|nr:response regulator transcription factor [Pseudomonas sp. PIA16]MDE1167946.1 response regulator transcription factor [Pseudomonas sp.]
MNKAMIVDDHPFIRASVKVVLEQDRFQVVAQTDNGVEAIALASEHVPDLAVVDISMPMLDGLEVIARIKALGLDTRVLVLTSLPADFYSLRCMKAGAAGFVCKADDLNELRKAVSAVMSGYHYFPDVSLSSVRRSDALNSEAQCIASLTDRELLVLQQLARGYSNKAIGDAMLLSNKTISTYKGRLIQKLRVRSLVDLADVAKRNSLI